MAPTATAWRSARRVLLVRLDNLGDVLMTTPALTAVSQTAPDMQLTLLCSPVGAALAGQLPAVDAVIRYRAPWVKGGADDSPAADDAALIAELAQRRFDAAIIFTVCTQSALPAALLCRLAGIPLRLAHSRENPYQLLSDWVPETDLRLHSGMRHEVRRQLDLVASVGYRSADEGLVLRWPARDALSLHDKLDRAGFDPRRPYVLLHPGVSAASRRYPAERFGAAAVAIAAGSGCQIVFSGDASEQALVAQARAAMPAGTGSLSLAGQLGLGELAALIAGARLVVCNNSAPAHIAAAVGTPVLVLYALTNPQHTPWVVASRVLNHDVPCRHCLQSICPREHQCLLGVPAAAVAEAALALLRTRDGMAA